MHGIGVHGVTLKNIYGEYLEKELTCSQGSTAG